MQFARNNANGSDFWDGLNVGLRADSDVLGLTTVNSPRDFNLVTLQNSFLGRISLFENIVGNGRTTRHMPTFADLFSLTEQEIIALGGSYERRGVPWNRRSEITFGDTTFRDDGTFREGNRGAWTTVASQSSNFILDAVMRGEPEMIMLGAHGAFAGAVSVYHMHIAMFVTEESRSVWENEAFQEFNSLLGGSIRVAYISGGMPVRPYLALELNRQDYINRRNLFGRIDEPYFVNHVFSGTGMANQLLDAQVFFEREGGPNFRYWAVPGAHWGDVYNSTSVTISLLNALDLEHGISGFRNIIHRARSWGINEIIPAHYFIRPYSYGR
jgi:hypothetical protein